MGCARRIAEQQQKHQQQQQHQVSFDFVMYQHLQKKSESLTEVWFCVILAMYFVGAPFLRERESVLESTFSCISEGLEERPSITIIKIFTIDYHHQSNKLCCSHSNNYDGTSFANFLPGD